MQVYRAMGGVTMQIDGNADNGDMGQQQCCQQYLPAVPGQQPLIPHKCGSSLCNFKNERNALQSTAPVIKNSDYADKQVARNSLLSHTFHSTVGRSPLESPRSEISSGRSKDRSPRAPVQHRAGVID